MGWPDIVIAFALGLGVLGGWWRGLVGEIISLLSWVVSIGAALLYQGQLDQFMHDRFHVGMGPAHALGMAAFGALAYAILFAVGLVAGGIAQLPVIRTFNRAGGALFGAAKTMLFLWSALYVALFFPLPSDLRSGLHSSPLVALLALPNEAVDARLRGALPSFAKPYADTIFNGHHV